MISPLKKLPPSVPLHITLLEKCETSLQTHIILAQLADLRKRQETSNQ